MERIDLLESLRNELKEQIDSLIDDAINRIRKVIENDALGTESQQSVDLQKVKREMGDLISEDSGSLVLDYSPLQVQSAQSAQSVQSVQSVQSSQSFQSTQSVQSTQPTQSLNANPSTHPQHSIPTHLDSLHTTNQQELKCMESPLKYTQIKSESLISPILNQRNKRNQKRSNDNTDPLFSRNISCITPIKQNPKNVKRAKTTTSHSTPPHFWSLDMPPSPLL